MSNRKYTIEFKEEAVKLITEQGYSHSETARRLGIPHANLSRWVKALEKDKGIKKTTVKDAGGLRREDTEELELLRKEVKKLKLEREILKKAAAFFANELN